MTRKALNADYSLADLAGELRDLNTKVNAAISVGGVAILVGGIVSWFLITSAIETSGTLGRLDERSQTPVPTDPVIIDKLNEILQKISAKPMQDKQGTLEVLPSQIGNWTGVRADSASKMADALYKSPNPQVGVWVYTDDKATVDSLKNALSGK